MYEELDQALDELDKEIALLRAEIAEFIQEMLED